MAYRRSLSSRATIFARKCHPSVSHLFHNDDRDNSPALAHNVNHRVHSRFLSNGVAKIGFGSSGGDRRLLNTMVASSSSAGFELCRHMSTSMGEDSDNFGLISDVAEVISGTAVQVSTPAIDEVAIAAADSFLPVKLLQYLIDGVHTYAGLNWWAAIALTTLLIRGATVPLLISQLKSTSKLSIMRPRLEEIKQQIQDGQLDTNEGQVQMQKLFKQYGVTPFTPLKGLLIQGPVFISFFIAIRNMAENVPSFKGGGAFWFVDLTTPDALYIFPVLTALTFLITVECNMQEGLENNPVGATMKKFSRVMAVLTVPFTMSFPKALFCYWVTSNAFSLVYGLVIKKPAVKKFLRIPDIPIAPPSATSAKAPSFASFYEALKQHTQPPKPKANKEEIAPPSASASKLTEHRISSSSVISQRLKSLEKQVKNRNKNKKR